MQFILQNKVNLLKISNLDFKIRCRTSHRLSEKQLTSVSKHKQENETEWSRSWKSLQIFATKNMNIFIFYTPIIYLIKP